MVNWNHPFCYNKFYDLQVNLANELHHDSLNNAAYLVADCAIKTDVV